MDFSFDLSSLSPLSDDEAEDNEDAIHARELFSREFISENTHHENIEEMVDAGPFNVENAEDMNGIEQKRLDAWVDDETRFDDWRSFSESARENTSQYGQY